MDVLARVLKIVLAALLAMLLVLVGLSVAGLVVLKYTDWSNQEGALTAVIETFTDWEVEALGSIDIALFFPTVVTVEDVELSQTSRQSSLSSVSADRFEISFDPLSPFLNERLIIHDIHSSGARIVARQTPETAPESPPPSIPAIGGARIRDSGLVYKTAQGEQDLRFHVARLDLVSQSQGNGLFVAGRGTIEGMDFTVDGSLGSLQKLTDSQAPLPVDLEVFIAEDRLGVQGEMAVREQGLTFDLNTSVDGNSLGRIARAFGVSMGEMPAYRGRVSASKSESRIAVDNLSLRLGESRFSGTAALQLDQPQPRLSADLSAPLLRRQDLDGLLSPRGPAGGEEQRAPVKGAGASDSTWALPFDVTALNDFSADVTVSVGEYHGGALVPAVSDASLEATVEEGRATLTGQLQAEFQQEDLDVQLEAELGPVTNAGEEPQPVPFSVGVSAMDDNLLIKGQVMPGSGTEELEMEVAAKGNNLGRFAQLAGLALVDVPAYEARLSATLAGQALALEDLSLSLGESRVSGSASVDLQPAVPRLSADLEAPLLRREDILSLVPEGSTDAKQQGSSVQVPSLEVLHSFGADVAVSVGEYRGQTLGPIVSGVDLAAALEDGRVTLSGQAEAEGLTFSLEGGLGPPAEPGAEPEPVPFMLKASALEDTFAVEGEILPGTGDMLLAVQVAARGNSLGRIAQAFSLGLGEVPAYTATLSANVFPEEVAFKDLQLTLGESALSGSGSLQLGGARPRLQADLDASKLRQEDINTLIPQGGTGAQNGPSGSPLGLDLLSGSGSGGTPGKLVGAYPAVRGARPPGLVYATPANLPRPGTGLRYAAAPGNASGQRAANDEASPDAQAQDRAGGDESAAAGQSEGGGLFGNLDLDIDLSVDEYLPGFLGPLLSLSGLDISLEDGRVTASGQVEVAELEAEVDASAALPFGKGGGPFHLELSAMGDRLVVDGVLMPEAKDVLVSLDARAEGNSLGRIAGAFGVPMGNVPAYKASLSAAGSTERVRVRDLQMTLGYSHLYGSATLQLDTPQPLLRADLGASMLRREDITSLIPQGPEEQAAEPVNLDFLRALDAQVDMAVAEYRGDAVGPAVQGGKLNLSLDEGELGLSGYLNVPEGEIDLTASLGPPPQQGSGSVPFSVEAGTFGDTLALDGQIMTGSADTLLTAEGALEGDSLGQVAGLFGMSLGEIPPYQGQFSARVAQQRAILDDVQLTLGQSRVQGSGRVQLEGERPYVEADLEVPLLRQQDIAGLLPQAEKQPQEESDAEQPAQATVFSREPIALDWLHQVNADLALQVKRVEGERLGAAIGEGLLEANLENGRLSVDPLRFGLADGLLEGTLLLSDRGDPPQLQADLEATDLDLDNLFKAITGNEGEGWQAQGEFRGFLTLRTSGNTANEWASRLDGQIGFAIFEGALPAVIVEAIGLDVTETLASGIGENALTDVNCGVVNLDVTDGVVQTEALILSTDDSNIVGNGQIDLAEERVDLQLEAVAKDFSVFASDSPIQISGPLTDIQASLLTGELAASVVAAAGLALVNPLLAAIPFAELGLAEEDRCRELEEELREVQAKSTQQ